MARFLVVNLVSLPKSCFALAQSDASDDPESTAFFRVDHHANAVKWAAHGVPVVHSGVSFVVR